MINSVARIKIGENSEIYVKKLEGIKENVLE